MNARGHQITLECCSSCGRLWYTPLPGCPYCGSPDVSSAGHDSAGTIYSWTTIHRSLEEPPAPVPYTIITVELDVGARVYGRLVQDDEPAAEMNVVCIEGQGSRLVFARSHVT